MYRYKAFISYRHNRRDKRVAARIQSAIEHARPPRGDGGRDEDGTAPARYVVFRDETELSLSCDLDASLKAALDQSEYLIVVCSEETRKSPWVLAEIDHFLATRDLKHVLTVLVSGDPEEVIPEALLTDQGHDDRGARAHSPLSANLTDGSGRYRPASFHREAVRILATLSQVSFDSLWQRERRYRARRLAVASGAAAAILLVVAVASVHAALTMASQRRSIQEHDAATAASNARLQLDALDLREASASAIESLELDPDGPASARAERTLAEATGAYGDDMTFELLADLPADVVRMVPTSDGSRLVVVDAEDVVRCLDAGTGDVLWESHDLAHELASLSPGADEYLDLYLSQDGSVLALCCTGDRNFSEGIDMGTGERVWSNAWFYPRTSLPGSSFDASYAADSLLFAEADEGTSQLVLHLVDVETGQERHTFETGVPAGPLVRYAEGHASCQVAWDQGQGRFLVAALTEDEGEGAGGAGAKRWYLASGTPDGACSGPLPTGLPGQDEILDLAIAGDAGPEGDGSPFLVLHGRRGSTLALAALGQDGSTSAERSLDDTDPWEEGMYARVIPVRDGGSAVAVGDTVALVSDDMRLYDADSCGDQVIAASRVRDLVDYVMAFTEAGRLVIAPLPSDDELADGSDLVNDRLEVYSLYTLLGEKPSFAGCAPGTFPDGCLPVLMSTPSGEGGYVCLVPDEDHSRLFRTTVARSRAAREVLATDSSPAAAGWSRDGSLILTVDGDGRLGAFDASSLEAVAGGGRQATLSKRVGPGFVTAPENGAGSLVLTDSYSFARFADDGTGTYAEEERSPYTTFVEGRDGSIRHLYVTEHGDGSSFDVEVFEDGSLVRTIPDLEGRPATGGVGGTSLCAAGRSGWLVVGLHPGEGDPTIRSFLAVDLDTGESRTIPTDLDVSPTRGIAVADGAAEFSVVTNDGRIVSYDIESGRQTRGIEYPHRAKSVVAAAYCDDDARLLLLTEKDLAVCDLETNEVMSTDELDLEDAFRPRTIRVEPSADGSRVYALVRNADVGTGTLLVLDRDTMGVAAVVEDVVDFDAEGRRLLRLAPSLGLDGVSRLMEYPIYTREELVALGREASGR